MRISVLDTTLLSNFAHAGRPDLLYIALNETAVTTITVLAELRQGETAGLVPLMDWSWITLVTLTSAEEKLAGEYRKVLDNGEAECLAVAKMRNGRFLSDDLAARQLAQAEGVAISGTIGVLLHLIHQGRLSVDIADLLLSRIRQSGYRSPVTTLEFLANKTSLNNET